MEIRERFFRRDDAESLTGNMDYGPTFDRLDVKDFEWIVVFPNRFEILATAVAFQSGHVPGRIWLRDEHFPIREIFPVEQRSPRFRCVRTESSGKQ